MTCRPRGVHVLLVALRGALQARPLLQRSHLPRPAPGAAAPCSSLLPAAPPCSPLLLRALPSSFLLPAPPSSSVLLSPPPSSFPLLLLLPAPSRPQWCKGTLALALERFLSATTGQRRGKNVKTGARMPGSLGRRDFRGKRPPGSPPTLSNVTCVLHSHGPELVLPPA